MAVTIDADPVSPTFNCYVSLADAIIIVDGMLNTAAWDAATTADKNRALLMATSLIDTHVDWYGLVTETDQLLEWPRSTVQIKGRPLGTYFPSDEIPDFLKEATSDFASRLLVEDRTVDQETGLSGIKVSNISVQFNRRDRKDVMPDSVKIRIKPYGTIINATSSTVRLVRA